MRTPAFRSGFSLIEALVVLAIGGMALAIIFSIGVKAGDTGFTLGRRAMSVADLDVSLSDVRSVFRSLALRPPETFNTAIDRPVLAQADRLEADVVMERATQCAPVGWTGRIVLAVQKQADQANLTCTADGVTSTLVTTTDPTAQLSYSTDGQTWSSAIPAAASQRGGQEMRSVQLNVRFRGGAVDIVETANSGRPDSWIRFDDPF